MVVRHAQVLNATFFLFLEIDSLSCDTLQLETLRKIFADTRLWKRTELNVVMIYDYVTVAIVPGVLVIET